MNICVDLGNNIAQVAAGLPFIIRICLYIMVINAFYMNICNNKCRFMGIYVII